LTAAWDKFWFSFRLSSTQVAVFRVAFFALLALDLWLEIVHAPRYGAGDFNVPHFPGLDSILPMPSRSLMLCTFLVSSVIAALLCVGRLSRGWLIGLSGLYGYTYLISQLDSYQHHWMMLLVLVVLCFARLDPRDREKLEVGDWPFRLILMTVSIVYLWAVITKYDPLWLDGRTISRQVSEGWVRDLIERFLRFDTAEPMAPYAVLAKLVMGVELFLAVAIHIRWLRWPAALLGMGFHLGIELSGFKIGLFSYYMVAIYLLVVPFDDLGRWLARWRPSTSEKVDGVASALSTSHGTIVKGAVTTVLGALIIFVCVRSAGPGAGRFLVGSLMIAAGVFMAIRGQLRAKGESWPNLPSVSNQLAAAGSVLAAAIVVAIAVPFDESRLAAGAIAVVGLCTVIIAWLDRVSLRRLAIGHLVAAMTLVALTHTTEVTLDYHRFWGGSTRRLGDAETSLRAYRKALEIDHRYAPGHLRVGRLLEEDDPDKALRHYQKAQDLAPNDHRGFLYAALVHSRAGRAEEAYQNAKMAAILAPDNAQAVRLRDHWQERR